MKFYQITENAILKWVHFLVFLSNCSWYFGHKITLKCSEIRNLQHKPYVRLSVFLLNSNWFFLCFFMVLLRLMSINWNYLITFYFNSHFLLFWTWKFVFSQFIIFFYLYFSKFFYFKSLNCSFFNFHVQLRFFAFVSAKALFSYTITHVNNRHLKYTDFWCVYFFINLIVINFVLLYIHTCTHIHSIRVENKMNIITVKNSKFKLNIEIWFKHISQFQVFLRCG